MTHPGFCHSIILELGAVTPLVPGTVPLLGVVKSLLVLGSGIFVLGTGMVIVVVGIIVPLVGAVVARVLEGAVVGSILLQAQAHRFSARIMPKTKMVIFFIKILLSV